MTKMTNVEKELQEFRDALPDMSENQLKGIHARVNAELMFSCFTKSPNVKVFQGLLKNVDDEMDKRGMD